MLGGEHSKKYSNGCGVFFQIEKRKKQIKKSFFICVEENKFYFLCSEEINLLRTQTIFRGRGVLNANHVQVMWGRVRNLS
jgi:hypothetical protein